VYAAVAVALWLVPPEALASSNVSVRAAPTTGISREGGRPDRRVERHDARVVPSGPATRYRTRLLVLLAIIVLVISLVYRTLRGWKPMLS